MARILKNKTGSEISITYENLTLIVDGYSQSDLSDVFKNHELAACDELIELLGQGIDKYQLNDGTIDLSVARAIDLIKGFQIIPAMDSVSRMRVSPEPRLEGSQAVIVSHNWCDKCTWYGQSVRVLGETLSTEDGYNFSSQHQYWVDLTHGRVYREDLVSSTYKPKVYVDGIVKTERTPFATSGGDFEINYENGTVLFYSDQTGKTITSDYSYQNGSRFIVAPKSGKKLWVEKSEVQFSVDVEINDTIHFQAWATNPYNPSQKIPVTEKTSYKVARDFVDEAQGVYPQVPAFGGTRRGLPCAHIVFPFNYLQIKEIKYSQGVEIRVWLEKNTCFGGTFGTATFYCTSFDE